MAALVAVVAVSVLALAATLLVLPVLAVVAVVRLLARAWRGSSPVPPPLDLSPEQLDSADPLIIAVHGTWAPVAGGKANWALAGSPLHGAIMVRVRRACGAEPIWYPFAWSGDNSAAGRGAAVDALGALVRAATARHPDRFVVLIGHSHGGNVAAVVAQRLADRPRLHVVTLATPFLTVLARKDTGPLGDLLSLVPGVALSLAAFAAARVVGGWPWLWAGMLLAGALGASGVLVVKLRRHRQSALDALAASTLDGTRLEALRPRAFIVSRIGDEADAGLKLTAFATNWIVRTVGRVGLVKDLAVTLARFDAGSAPAVSTSPDAAVSSTGRRAAGAVTTPAYRSVLWRGVRDWWWRRGMATLDLAALVSGLFLLSLLQVVAGTSSALASVALNVGSSETPPGTWRHLQSTWSGEANASLLSHSQIYDDAVVLDEVATWVAGVATGVR